MALKAQILHEKTLLQVDLWYSDFEKGIKGPFLKLLHEDFY